MIRRKAPERNPVGTAREAGTDVDIVYSKVTRHTQQVEHIMLYGFVHDRQGQAVGYSLSCTVKWRTEEYSLDSGDELARNYFRDLVFNYSKELRFIGETALQMRFTDPELDALIGMGSGF